jgi:SAM-dependent methyltransferase
MSDEMNPQARQMADESMVRNLRAQAECIWPQEQELFRRYRLGGDIRILDAGCGPGEITGRLAELYPSSSILGVDIVDAHLDMARSRLAHFSSRVRFEHRSIFDLGLPDCAFDLVACRHVLQAIPHPERVLAELVRVTRPGGRLHVLAEDYGMMTFPVRNLDPDEFWRNGPQVLGRKTGTDMRIGRHAFTMLNALGLRDISVDHVVVDVLRAPRESFAAIWEAWRDGYAGVLGENTSFSEDQVRAHFDDMGATIRDPSSYAAWFVPVISGIVPDAS